ncbi:DUF3667 domain-containing protein [Winogradskyella sp.]|uniref:DUF3667 domain-containing protein n=1 Tax=Winogradskyella sp. TaxID=1883156 RepID=UPI0025F92DBF|nr:DUF3667 domain-containing protein [Winogradskyella sp.]
MDCKNCNKTLNNNQCYCDDCGAKVIQNRLTPKILAAQVNEQFISIDNKFLRTFIDLFKKPEAVIDGYIHGTRKKYIDVLQYFAISLTLAGIQVFLMKTFFKEALEFSPEILQAIESSPSQKNNPFLNGSFDDATKYQGIIYILTVPFSALATWLGYYFLGERSYNFTEHLVLNLYYSAQIIIITAVFSIIFLLFGLNYLIVSTLITLPTFIYLFYVLKRVFKDSFWETFARFLFVMVIYIGVFFIIGILIVLAGIIFGITSHK